MMARVLGLVVTQGDVYITKRYLLGSLAGLTPCVVLVCLNGFYPLVLVVLKVQCNICQVGLVWYKLIKGSLSKW